VGRFLDQLAVPGPTAALALLCGLGAMLLGILLIMGVLRSRSQRLVVLEPDADPGVLAAKPGALRDMARALAEHTPGVTHVRRPKLTQSSSGRRRRLNVTASHARTGDARELQDALRAHLEPISEPFNLNPRVRVRVGERGERVQ
jgi:hypothetical protein